MAARNTRARWASWGSADEKVNGSLLLLDVR